MFCNKCGNEISNDAKFCTKCGNKVESIKNKIQKREYEFSSITNGGKSKIIIEAGKMTIIRPGVISKFSHGFTGEKTILIKDISAVQLKLAGISRGYLQFIFVGSMEARSGMLRGEKTKILYILMQGLTITKLITMQRK